MKILLVKPYNLSDHIQPSLGLGYLAASIRPGHDVKILDCIKEKIDIDKLSKYIRCDKPDVIGFQCYTFDLPYVRDALKAVKMIDKNIVTMLGGPHPSAMPAEVMSHFGDTIDFLFAGEAENGLGKLLGLIKSGDKDLSSVPGLVWREGGKIRTNPRTVTEDLNAIVMPAWDLIHPEEYPEAQHGAFFKNFPMAPIMITRGCPYLCTFCAGHVVSGRKIRCRSIDNVLKELTVLNKDFGIKEFHIVDDNFTFNAAYAKEFLRKLKKLNLGMSWSVPNGVRMDTLDEELLGLMKDTGLYIISLGIESGSDEVLRDMKKSMTIAKIRTCVERIRRCGIDVSGFFIVGFPGETVESIRKTIRLACELDLVRANFFTYLPFPGSESYKHLHAEDGLGGVDWQNFYFMNAAYTPKGLSRKKLKALQREAFAKFYLRPHIIFYNLKSIKSLGHLWFLMKRFFNWIVAG